MEKVKSYSFFSPVPSEVEFCISYQHIIPETCPPAWTACLLQSQTKSFVLHLVTILCCLDQRGISFDAQNALCVVDKKQYFLEHWKC